MFEMSIWAEKRIQKEPELLGRAFLVPLCYAAGICSELIGFWNILLSVLCNNMYIVLKEIPKPMFIPR